MNSDDINMVHMQAPLNKALTTWHVGWLAGFKSVDWKEFVVDGLWFSL